MDRLLVLCHSLIVGYIGSQAIVSFDEIARETLLFSLDRALAGVYGGLMFKRP
jgi:hypothetical protein